MLHSVIWNISAGEMPRGIALSPDIGSLSPMHPHHRPSVADGITDPVPGLLAGGPNPGEQDHCHYDFHEPETAYVGFRLCLCFQ